MFSKSCWRFLSFPASGLPPWEIRKRKLTDEVQLKYIGITFKNLLIQTVDFLSGTNVPIESLAKNMNTWLFDHKNREKSVTPGTLLLKEWCASFVTLVNGDICQIFFFSPFSFQEIINCLQALNYFETGITAHPLVRRYQQTQISAWNRKLKIGRFFVHLYYF